MKIAQITPYMHSSAGGPPVVVDRLSHELVVLGHEVHVIATDLYGSDDRRWRSQDNRTYGMDIWPTSWPHGYAYSRQFSSAIVRIVQSADIVHIHTLWTFASLSAARACVAAGVPYLVMPHGMLDPHSVARGRWKKQLYGRLLEWPLLRQANGICYTHPEEERLARQVLPSLPKGHIVELGVEEPPVADRAELRAEFFARRPELQHRRMVLFLGRLHGKKGLDLLLPAMEKVVRSIPTAHLLLVGPGEENYVDSIRRLVSVRGLEESVTITGPLYERHKWAAMAASDLFVLPSYQENFALAAVDAIRGGLPVLLSRRVNLWQDIVDAGAGCACDLTVDSVAEQIHQCLIDENWRTSATAAGEKLLQQRFNWARSAGKLSQVYDAILATSSSSKLSVSSRNPDSNGSRTPSV